MKSALYWRLYGAALVLMICIGCVPYPISKQLRLEAVPEASVPAVQENPQAFIGKTVIWGGDILELTNDSSGSVIMILETPLDRNGFPKPRGASRGRFIATTHKFLDPAIYKTGSPVTLAGEVTGVRKQTLGNSVYPYPVVAIKELRYWQYNPYYSPYYLGPYGYPYYPPWWYSPFDYPYYYPWWDEDFEWPDDDDGSPSPGGDGGTTIKN